MQVIEYRGSVVACISLCERVFLACTCNNTEERKLPKTYLFVETPMRVERVFTFCYL